jgi:nitrous oxide reductase accessory protein NosL
MSEQEHKSSDADAEPMIYEEPARLSWKEMLGVGLALVALAVIGVAGYIWLTPGLDLSTIRARMMPQLRRMEMKHSAPGGMAGAQVAESAESLRCDYCGMAWADSSARVLAVLNAGGVEDVRHFDSLGCAYKYAQEHNGGALSAKLQVLEYTAEPAAQPVLLDTQAAWYLYGTQPLPGSMPPFIAAFASKDASLAQQGKLGGELLQFEAVDERLRQLAGMKAKAPAQLVAKEAPTAEQSTSSTAVVHGASAVKASSAADPLSAAQLSKGDTGCPVCGMRTPASGSHCVALWSDGSRTHHDCWDCLLTYGKERGLSLQRAVVIARGSSADAPRWLEAASAWYLYGTQRIEMSMPPYVAAFASKAEAEAAQPELGGEVLDFAGLKAQWK